MKKAKFVPFCGITMGLYGALLLNGFIQTDRADEFNYSLILAILFPVVAIFAIINLVIGTRVNSLVLSRKRRTEYVGA